MVDAGRARVLLQDHARPVDGAAQEPSRLREREIVLGLAHERVLLPQRARDERGGGDDDEHGHDDGRAGLARHRARTFT